MTQGREKRHQSVLLDLRAFDLALLTATTFIALPNTARPFEYEMEGLIAAREYTLKQTNVFEAMRVKVYVRDSSWLMHAQPSARDRLSRFVSYYEFGSDGNSYYRLAVYKPGVARDAWLGGVEDGCALNFSLAPQVAVAWLATASQCSLDKATNSLLPPYSRDLTPTPASAVVRRRNNEPRLPERIFFLSEGYSRAFGKPTRYSSPYDRTFTNAIFHALGFTNIGGLDLPTRFRYQAFEPVERHLATIFECEGTLLTFRNKAALESFQPKLPAETVAEIKDFRFQSPKHLQENPFVYRTARWLTAAEVRELPDFNRYIKWEEQARQVPKILSDAAPRGTPPSMTARTVTLVIVGLTSAVFIVLWKISSRHKQQT